MKKNKKKGKIYVVIAIDTEGPIVNKKKPEIINKWSDIKKLIKILTNQDFRNYVVDSSKKGIKYSWFLLTLTGFKTNPFKRPMKYNQTFNFYKKNFFKNFNLNEDGVYWHYHQPSPSGIGNEWCKNWSDSQEYINILNRLLIDQQFFPSCFRAGGRIEDNDLSNWLEEYIPFDYSNCSGDINWNRIESDGKRLIDVADWSKASRSWKPYHPSKKNYQYKGSQKRHVFRCLDVNSPVYSITKGDIRQAFRQASNGEDVVLSIFEHDRRFNVINNLKFFLETLNEISKKFPKIKWYFKNARDAAISSQKINSTSAPKFKISKLKDKRLMIETKDKIFGSRPYACIKTSNKKYIEIPLIKVGFNKWITSQLIFKNFNFYVVANNNSGNNRPTKALIKL